ncbi:Ig-like domain repeat protein [Pontibacter sp. 13R65]|uniref:Ig-like domain repeat protein n=1 Tax=Pontibacter sp. 13R65 TaxID=3127458 RepID=UPI00301BE401
MKNSQTTNARKSDFMQRLATYSKVCFIALAVGLGACKDDDVEEITPGVDGPGEIVEIQAGNITQNTTWTADKIYRLNGYVRVGTDPVVTGQPTATATLTIEPGTVIIGDRESKGTLIIQRGSKIIAKGTKEKPIVFTSERAPGLREPGDWGGVVICGFAHNNLPSGVGELEGGYGAFYGGTNDDDNSGELTYVRIEYAGIPINPNQEVNSLTMGSVGRGTKIENIMCSYGLDDSFEWFGGTVNAKNLIAYRGLDDDFDMDAGYTGRLQFILGVRDPRAADQSGSNGFEVDNDGDGSTNTPFTAPQVSNATILGGKATTATALHTQFQNGAHLRRNTKIKIYNSFITGYPNGIYIDGSSTVQNATNNELQVKNTILAGVDRWGGNGYGSASADGSVAQHPNAPRGKALTTNQADFDINAWFMAADKNNQMLAKWQDAGIDGSLFELGTPKVTPTAGSMLMSGASFAELTGFESVEYRGAFGTVDWTEGWAAWDAATREYLK